MKYPQIHTWFSQTAEQFREQIALACGEQQITYGQLEEKANNLANFLIVNGVTKDSLLYIVTQDTITVITAILATLKAGGIFVPLSHQIPPQMLQDILLQIPPDWLIADEVLAATLDELNFSKNPQIILNQKSNFIDFLKNDKTQEYQDFWNTQAPNIERDPEGMCYLYFTSGSTGKPKAIAGRLKAISHFINWEINTLKLGKNIRVSQLINPAFDAFLRDIFVPLCSGGMVCIPENLETILDGRKLVNWIDRQQINLIHCVPSLFRSLLQQEPPPNQFAALQYILLSGEPLLPADVNCWMQRYGEHIQLVNLYGASETTMTKFFYFVKPSDAQQKMIPIGKPIEGAAAIIIDQAGKTCSPGMVGEIYIRTPYRTLGYYQQPELTQEVFIQNPFSDKINDIVYKTGDLGRILPDGNFEYLGRKDRQVKIRGVRIELGEIENALQHHSQITESAVLAWNDRHGSIYLCAYLVLTETLETSQIREFLLDRLPEPMIPAIFQEMESLPRTISGKIDRQSLPEPQQQNRPLIPPRTPIEAELVKIWQQVLDVTPISVEDNFFALGGHSLLITQIMSRIEFAFQIKLPIKTLFESPTLAKMANSIETLLWLQETPPTEATTTDILEEGEL
jgi:amino acid adenylation domain-containing protein